MNLYARILTRIDDPAIGNRAAALLRQTERRAQKAGVQILIEKPSVAALDRLWELRCELEGDNENFFLRMQVDEALASCLKLDSSWIRRTIERSDPAREPFTALVYLLAQLGEVEGGPSVWAQVRETVLRKAPESAKRALSYVIESFGDHEARSRMAAWVATDEDLAAPAALRALELLSPDDALDALEHAPLETSLLIARSWWLPQLLAFRYERTSAILYRKIGSHERPWLAAGVYDNRENLITPDLLDLLLDVTEALLEKALAEPESDRDPLYRPFHFLADVARFDLMERFETRRGTRFEEALTAYLIREGPGDKGWRRWKVERGISVLQRVGGSGFTALANDYLRSAQTREGIRQALLLAVRRPDSETERLVAEVAHDPVRGGQMEGGFPSVQYETVKALAGLSQWRETARAVMRLGLSTPKSLPEYLAGHVFTDEELVEVLVELRSGAPSPGSILMAGMSGRTEFAREILAIYGTSEHESDHALACLLALEALHDQGSTQLFIENLESPKNGWVAARALLGAVRSPDGDAALLDRLHRMREAQERDDAQLIAMNLLIRADTRARAASVLWEDYERDDLHFLVGDTIQYLALPNLAGVAEFLRSTALADRQSGWHADRSAAIEGLSRLDRTAAYDAAKVLLRSKGEDRLLAPEHLLALEPTAAIAVVREMLATSKDFLLMFAIGEALDKRNPAEALQVWLEESDPRIRQGACFVMETLQWTAELEALARPRVHDRSWDVRVAARAAYEALLLSRETGRLIDAVAGEGDLSRRWNLVDAALAIGYPGVVSGHGAYSWFGRMLEGQPYALQRQALSRLDEARKRLRDDLAKRERD